MDNEEEEEEEEEGEMDSLHRGFMAMCQHEEVDEDEGIEWDMLEKMCAEADRVADSRRKSRFIDSEAETEQPMECDDAEESDSDESVSLFSPPLLPFLRVQRKKTPLFPLRRRSCTCPPPFPCAATFLVMSNALPVVVSVRNSVIVVHPMSRVKGKFTRFVARVC